MSKGTGEHFVTVVPVSEKGIIVPLNGHGSSSSLGSHQGQLHPIVRTSHSSSHNRVYSAPNVTVLEVKNNMSPVQTALMATPGHENGTHNTTAVLDHATIYRLPGERLGMALKFVGGTNADDTVSRVFIQSINLDSPASRAQSKVAPIREGDEILRIDEREVTSMTRLDCVRLLKDSPVCINLTIRHMGGAPLPETPSAHGFTSAATHLSNGIGGGGLGGSPGSGRTPSPSRGEVSTPGGHVTRSKREPPPIPPRKGSVEPRPTSLPPLRIAHNANGGQGHNGHLSKQSPERPHTSHQGTLVKSSSTKSLDRIGSSGIVRPSMPPPLPPRKPTKDVDSTHSHQDDHKQDSLKENSRPQSVPPPPPPRRDAEGVRTKAGKTVNN
ncbi:hypothetical protein BIW11_12923, partial [Tropilaelaps mercedesae]